jgi:hypothetical protein
MWRADSEDEEEDDEPEIDDEPEDGHDNEAPVWFGADQSDEAAILVQMAGELAAKNRR